MQKPKRYLYEVYGLTVASEIELPELSVAKSDIPDVFICFGSVPNSVEDNVEQWSWCIASRTEFVFNVEGVAKYHVVGGRSITVERRLGLEEGVPSSDLRLWLLGTAFGALLHQRGLLPLHVSAVNGPTGVWSFTGRSGEGKSTLAAALNRQYGWQIISDDVSAVMLNEGKSEIYPGPRRLKLCSDAIDHLALDRRNGIRDFSRSEKYQFYLPDNDSAGNAITNAAYPLHALVILDSSPLNASPGIEVLTGSEAFNACAQAVYHPWMTKWFKPPHCQAMELFGLCNSIKVYRYSRPRSLDLMAENLAALVDLMQGPSL